MLLITHIQVDSNAEGFNTVKADDKQHYFIVKNASGNPILYSQGYGSGTARDNGIKTVIKN
nr:YegP family protein [Arcicella sp.]